MNSLAAGYEAGVQLASPSSQTEEMAMAGSPMCPVGPVGPVGPVQQGPVAPVAPVAPVIPVGPIGAMSCAIIIL